MKQLAFKNLRSYIFSTLNLAFFEFPLENSNRGWENPNHVYSERYRNEDSHLLEELLNAIDIDDRYTMRFTMEEVDQRIKDGHIFYVAKKREEIIGYCWYLVSKVKIPIFNATLYLNQDEVCSFNSYIQPKDRGKGIRNYMRAYEYNELNKLGYNRAVAYVDEINKAALRMHQKWGSIQIGTIKRIRILTLIYDYSNITTNKIDFQNQPFLLWKNLYHKFRTINSK